MPAVLVRRESREKAQWGCDGGKGWRGTSWDIVFCAKGVKRLSSPSVVRTVGVAETRL